MKATLALSNVRVPTHGRFVNCKQTYAQIVRVANVPHVDLVQCRDGGPYIVLRLDIDGAVAIRDHINTMLRCAAGAEE